MNSRLAWIGALSLVLPIAIENPRGDSTRVTQSETRFELGGGVGYYALIDRGCSGKPIRRTPVHYQEVGAAVEHRFDAPLAVGIRGGWRREEFHYSKVASTTNRYINPHLALETRTFGLGGGAVFAHERFPISGDPNGLRMPFSAHLRLGELDVRYLTLSIMENVPLYSGGGYYDLTLGFRPSARVEARLGLSGGGPYDGGGAIVACRWWWRDEAAVEIESRLGHSGGQFQNGIALGLEIRRRAGR